MERGEPIAFEEAEKSKLAGYLKRFYGELRDSKGQQYSSSSLLSIRSGLQRHLSRPPHEKNINLIFEHDFKPANRVLTGKIRVLKEKGLDTSTSHKAISLEHIQQMYSTGALSTSSPLSLQHKVYFEVALHFVRGGREILRELSKDHFIFRVTPDGAEYATLKLNPVESNSQGIGANEGLQHQRMYATGNKNCPVASLRSYLEKLNPKCSSFFQRPKLSNYEGEQIWY